MTPFFAGCYRIVASLHPFDDRPNDRRSTARFRVTVRTISAPPLRRLVETLHCLTPPAPHFRSCVSPETWAKVIVAFRLPIHFDALVETVRTLIREKQYKEAALFVGQLKMHSHFSVSSPWILPSSLYDLSIQIHISDCMPAIITFAVGRHLSSVVSTEAVRHCVGLRARYGSHPHCSCHVHLSDPSKRSLTVP